MFHVIDDQPYIRESVSAVLESFGYKTLCFSCPKEYLNYVSRPEYKKPLAVITDITMPAMNGYQLIDQVSRLIPNLRFVVISGEPNILAKNKSRACMYLRKPFRAEKLIEVTASISMCAASTPSCSHNCANVGDRNHFGMLEWKCPLGCNTCEDGC